jgi:opacity protein-like surface antigen
LFAAVFAAVMAAPAAAQTQDQNSAASTVVASNDATNVSFNLPATVSFDAQAKPASPTHQMGGKQVQINVQGGFVFGGGSTGFDLGVGAMFQPMKDNDKLGIIVDGNFVRDFSSNGLYISVNAVYNVHLQNSKAKPFVGGGVGIIHFSGDTETKPQLLGGVGWALSSGREVNGQFRIVFTDFQTTTLLLFGFAF